LGAAQLDQVQPGFVVINVDDLGVSEDVTFDGNTLVAGWSAGQFEVELTPGVWSPGINAPTQTSANTIRFGNPAWAVGIGGLNWRILTAPAGVAAPQSGTIP